MVGRKKDLIISGGENDAPAEVDELLYAHPAITGGEAAAAPVTRGVRGGMSMLAAE